MADVAVRYAARSDLGLGPKTRNEDSAYAGPHLLVLADGMGGHAAGDVASSMIVGALAPLDDETPPAEHALDILDQTFAEANARIAEAAAENPKLCGMGSTTIALLRTGNKLAMAHIGDSRAYLLRDGKVSQMTRDHSFVQALLDEGRITAEEAEHHPQRFLVTRVMTGMPDDEPDLSLREAMPGDRYLLCSDGLSDYVRADAIEEILVKAATPEEAADRLIAVALKASTRDNVTVVVADVVDLDLVDPPSTVPVVVGAVAERRQAGGRTRGIPVSPAEKAAALSREATGRDETAAESDDTDPDTVTLAEEPVGPRARWARRIALLTVLSVVAIAALLAYNWSQRQYYVTAVDGRVVVYQGVPQSLGPWQLSHLDSTSDVLVADLPPVTQELVGGTIQVASQSEAAEKLELLRTQAVICRLQTAMGSACTGVLPIGTPATPATPTTPATPSTAVTTPAHSTPAKPPAPTATVKATR